MKTKAVRLYGKHDLRLEEFELPEITDDEILAEIVTDSVCMSTYKAQYLGTDHARVPKDVAEHPVIVGHEMCGKIVSVGENLKKSFKPGDKFVIQPALPDAALQTIGYSYRYCGGDATYVVIPKLYIDQGCVLPYDREDYFSGSLAEPMSCIIGGYKVNYHNDFATHEHKMGIVENGNCAIMAGVGPMGLGAIDYALHGPRRPKLLVVTDINKERLQRAESIFTPKAAAEQGVTLVYLDTSEGDTVSRMLELTDNVGYDDVFVYAPVSALIEQADAVLAKDGCLNFFAGPTDNKLSARFNFYDVHYKYTHVAGNTGGNAQDMTDCIDLMNKGLLNPAVMVTHVGGLDSAAETTKNLPSIPGGKKLVYTHINMPMTAISDFRKLGENDSRFVALADICDANNGLWCAKAEKYLLKNF